MTLYGRSDLAAVTVSEAHGGCGTTHSRPVEHGAPAKVWKLECPNLCEQHLRHDPHWSTTLSEIPETYDETKAREDFDKRGARDRDQVLALALARLAGVELPESLLRPITGNLPHIPGVVAGKILCPAEHENPPGSEFCNKCGAKLDMRDARAINAPQDGPGPPQSGNGNGGLDLMDMHPQTLARMCREAGVDDTGGKADMAARLREAQHV